MCGAGGSSPSSGWSGPFSSKFQLLSFFFITFRPPRNRTSVLSDPAVGEANLVDRCRRGDRDALEQVFRREGPALVRLLTRLVGDRHDVDDLVQNTFVEAISAFPRFRGDASVRTWLSRIAVNVVRQKWRRKAVRQRARLELVANDVDPAAPIDDVADDRRRLDRVYQHLAKIAIKKRLAFSLHVLDGRPIDEVAALMSASVTATRSRVFWARKELRASARRDPVLCEWLASVQGEDR